MILIQNISKSHKGISAIQTLAKEFHPGEISEPLEQMEQVNPQRLICF